MEKQFQQIKEALSRLDDIQATHIDSFDTDLLPDLEFQLDERNTEFSRLMKMISQFIAKIELDAGEGTDSMVIFLMEGINTLLVQNKILKKRVTAHRDSLQESMKNLSRGKQVIGSYGSPSSNGPRAINLTN